MVLPHRTAYPPPTPYPHATGIAVTTTRHSLGSAGGGSSTASSPPGSISSAAPSPFTPHKPSANAAAATSTEAVALTKQDKAALDSFLRAFQSQNNYLASNATLAEQLSDLQQTVAAHQRTLDMLVNKQKECPSLFWFYPKRKELRNWLVDPVGRLFQDTLMMVVVCPVTLCVVECGPDGVGWEIHAPKAFMKKWGPAIIFSIYVLQAAVLTGRAVGLPLPHMPLGAGVHEVLGNDKTIMSGCLCEMATATVAVMDDNKEMHALCEHIQQGRAAAETEESHKLAVDVPTKMVNDSYRSIHTFLTTGINAKLGALEDQLRGCMERVLAPNGDMEWVSMEGKPIWLAQRQQLQPPPSRPPAVSSVVIGVAVEAQGIHSRAGSDTNLVAQATLEVEGEAGSPKYSSWLAQRLTAGGVSARLVSECDQILVVNEGFVNEELLAAMPPALFTEDYLAEQGIYAKSLQQQLLCIHQELHRAYLEQLQQPQDTDKDKSNNSSESSGVDSVQPVDAKPLQLALPSPAPAASPEDATDSTSTSALTPFTLHDKEALAQIQDAVLTLREQLQNQAKLQQQQLQQRGASANTNIDLDVDLTVGGGGGSGAQQLLAKKAVQQSNKKNGGGSNSYTSLDELMEELMSLKRQLAAHEEAIASGFRETETRLEDVNSGLPQSTSDSTGKKSDSRGGGSPLSPAQASDEEFQTVHSANQCCVLM